MNKNVKRLFLYLIKSSYMAEAKYLKNIIANAGEEIFQEIEIDDDHELLDFLRGNPGQKTYFDTPITHEKKFGEEGIKLPFHYGEFPELINPADDMGWDIIIVPSQSKVGEEGFDYGHKFIPVGIVKVNPDEEEWRAKTVSDKLPNGKPSPVGNDKIILAKMPWSVKSNPEDVSIIDMFFEKLWQYSYVKWYE